MERLLRADLEQMKFDDEEEEAAAAARLLETRPPEAAPGHGEGPPRTPKGPKAKVGS